MKGRYKVIVRNHRVTYTLEIERNITVIRGDSATGKTSLIRSLLAYDDLKEKSGVTVNCSKPCHVFRGSDWEAQLAKWTGSIVFADEGNSFIASRDFANAIKGSDNYYVFITRENLYQLPYSVEAVLEMKKTTSRFKHTYNRTYPYYRSILDFHLKLPDYHTILTEDSNAGYEWFSCIAGHHGVKCLSASGKSAVLQNLKMLAGHKTMVFGDGAAFGAEMENVYRYMKLHTNDIALYLPESFEWLILKSAIVSDGNIQEILDAPYDYADSTRYFSWEQLFTEVLTQTSRDTLQAYRKRKLNPCYLQEGNVSKILQVIENG